MNKFVERLNNGEVLIADGAAGARIVDGCCGSSPEYMAGIAKAVKSRN